MLCAAGVHRGRWNQAAQLLPRSQACRGPCDGGDACVWPLDDKSTPARSREG